MWIKVSASPSLRLALYPETDYHTSMQAKKNIIIAAAAAIVIVVALFVWKMSLPNDSGTAPHVRANVPAPMDTKSVGKVVRDSTTGKDFFSNQLIIEFNTNVTVEEALAVIASFGGKMEQRFTAVPLFLIHVEDPGDGSFARAALQKFSADARVKRADLNYLTTKPNGNVPTQ